MKDSDKPRPKRAKKKNPGWAREPVSHQPEAVAALGKLTRNPPETIAVSTAKRNRVRKSQQNKTFEPWSPNEVHLNWYYHWTHRFISYAQIAAEAGVSRNAVREAVSKVTEWFRTEQLDEIMDAKQRQIAALERIASESFQAWNKSKDVGVTVTTETGADGKSSVKRQERHQCGDATYLSEARSALSDIRKILGLDKPTEIALVNAEDSELERVAGVPREEAIRRQALKMLSMVEGDNANQSPSPTKP